jgi:RNA polymerase sigma factor (sigma-70 family)
MAVTERSQAAARSVDDLYRRHGAEVYRYAYAVLGNRADAEDVTQTTFLNAYRALEQGVHPRKPANWLLTIASNAIKQRFRQESARPRQVALDVELAGASADDEGPTVGELLTALSRISPQQRQAIVLREFEGRSYKEIAGILGITTAALETLLFRARRSLAEALEHHLTCTEAQLAVSRAVDGRLGRRERRRLRDHLAECPDCSRFARLQPRHRNALRGLVLMPVPILSLPLLRGLEDTAAAATLPAAGGASAAAVGAAATGGTAVGGGAAGAGGGIFTGGTAGGGLLAGGAAAKAAAVVAAASVAGGVGVVGASEISTTTTDRRPAKTTPGERLGQTAPRGALVPGRGVARGKATAPGQARAASKRPAHATQKASTGNAKADRAKAATSRRRAGNDARAKTAREDRAPIRRGAPARAKTRTQPAQKDKARVEQDPHVQTLPEQAPIEQAPGDVSSAAIDGAGKSAGKSSTKPTK